VKKFTDPDPRGHKTYGSADPDSVPEDGNLKYFFGVLTKLLIWKYCTSFLLAIFPAQFIAKLSCFCCIFRCFRFVSKQICLFRLFRNGSKTPKQTETNRKFVCCFRETNRKWTETDWVSACFGSNRKHFLFVSRTPYVKYLYSTMYS
jgi:hypothetical protein